MRLYPIIKNLDLKRAIVFISILFISLIINYIHAAEKVVLDSSFVADEKHISKLAAELIEVRFDDAKLNSLSKQLMDDFDAVLKKEGSFNYPFDSIPSIGKIVSSDGLVRIFTWYAVRADGSHTHFGFIQYHNKNTKQVLLFPLIDKSDEIQDVENAVLSADNWLGATYYQIIDEKTSFGQLYVLLGWDGNTIYSNKKVVESLIFTESGRPKFGKTAFVFGKEKVKRIIFEYSRMATMMLSYDSELKMIVMDHLSPSKPIYQGNMQFYGPDLSYDALKFEADYWVYYPIIDYKPVTKKKPKKNR